MEDKGIVSLGYENDEKRQLSGTYIEGIAPETFEDRLLEAEKKWEAIFDHADVPIFLTDAKGCLINSNKEASIILGYSKEEMLSLAPNDILTDKYSKIVNKTLTEILKKGYIEFSTELRRKDKSIIFVSCKSKHIKLNNKGLILTIAKDLTEKRKADEEKLKELLKYDLKDAVLYHAEENERALALDAFRDLLSCGYAGIIISSRSEDYFRKAVDLNFKFYWISNQKISGSLPPEYNCIDLAIGDIERKSVVLIDDMEYLEARSDYRNTLLFLKSLKEQAMIKCSVFILCVDTGLIREKNAYVLKKETSKIELRSMGNINNNMERILKFVRDRNNVGDKPMLTNIGKTLNITRPTIKSNVSRLISKNYLVINAEGRRKRLEITRKGRERVEDRIC